MNKQLKTLLVFSILVLAFMTLDLFNKGNQLNIIYILWGLSPTIAAIVTAAIFYSWSDIKDLFNRLARKFELVWLARLILLQLITYSIGLIIYAVIEGIKPGDFSVSTLTTIPVVFATAFVMNIWEEIGWRGFLLEKLNTEYSVFISSLLVGLLWGCWHIAYFLNNPNQSSFPFISAAIFWMVCSSFIYSYIYLRSGRSIFAAGIFHALSNTLQSVVINSALNFVDYFYFLIVAVALVAISLLVWQRNLFFTKGSLPG